jgi:glycerophosphoryl diester phosphodiesterase
MTKRKILKIAHKGASGHSPENTIEAFKKALELDCEVVEFDIHKTKDSHIVVMHDHNVAKTTDGIGNIRDLTLVELKRFHEPNGESIPTLPEAFSILKGKKRMLLDIKDQNMEEELLRLVEGYGVQNDVIIDSDIMEVVKKIKKLNPSIHVYLGGTTSSNYKRIIQEAKKINAEMIKVQNTLVDKNLVTEAHKNEIGVYVWAAEELDEIKKVADLEVDAIVCDFPDRIP